MRGHDSEHVDLSREGGAAKAATPLARFKARFPDKAYDSLPAASAATGSVFPAAAGFRSLV